MAERFFFCHCSNFLDVVSNMAEQTRHQTHSQKTLSSNLKCYLPCLERCIIFKVRFGVYTTTVRLIADFINLHRVYL